MNGARHCIIGAGFCGLPIARTLASLGESFDVFDRNDGVGGLWHTGVYRDAHLISSKLTTQFPDWPMPADYPDFPSKAQMQRYFESYANHFGLRPHIQLNRTVTDVRPLAEAGPNARWRVTLDTGETRDYATVAIANGHNWSPREVLHPGHFNGEILRSNAYATPAQLADRRVLVVGYGNTGCDIAVEAARVGRRAAISMRSGNYFFPKTFMGVPLADLLFRLPVSVGWIDRLLARLVLALTVGDLARYGIQKPKHRPLDKHPIINSELLAAIRHGVVDVKPDVERFDGDTVIFVDGTLENYDLVVYATGYRCSFPMLAADSGILDWKGERPILFLQMIAPRQRGLFFPGIGQARTGGGPLYQSFGELVARMMAYDAHAEDGVIVALRTRSRLRWLNSALARKLTGEIVVRPASFRSIGIGEARRQARQLNALLDAIGAPGIRRPAVKPVRSSPIGAH